MDTVFRCGSNQAKGDNYVPQPPGYAPINIAQDAAGLLATTLPVYLEHPVYDSRLVRKLSMCIFTMENCCRLYGRSMHFEHMQPQQAAVVLV